MATGFMQRFQGKIKTAQLWLGSGGIGDAVSGIVGKTDYIQKLSLPVTAATNTDFTMSVPTGCTILSMTVYTTTAYGAVTDAKIQAGSSAGDASYFAATTIKAAAVATIAFATGATGVAGVLSMPSGSPNLFIRIVQSGGNSATGAATLVLNYTV